MSDVSVAAGVSFELVKVGILVDSMADCKVFGVVALLRVDHEEAALLQFDQCLVGGG